MPAKKYRLTQLADLKESRRVYIRRDANCPVIAHVRKHNGSDHVGVPSWLVNISEDGCMITSDYFPERAEDIYVIIPGLGAKIHGKARSQGKYTINVKFTTMLTTDVVDKIGRIKTVPKN